MLERFPIPEDELILGPVSLFLKNLEPFEVKENSLREPSQSLVRWQRSGELRACQCTPLLFLSFRCGVPGSRFDDELEFVRGFAVEVGEGGYYYRGVAVLEPCTLVHTEIFRDMHQSCFVD